MIDTLKDKSFTTRTANIADLDALSPLFNDYRIFYQFADEPLKAKQFIEERLQKKDSSIIVAENCNQQLMGFCQLYFSHCSLICSPIATLYDLYVSTHYRKNGVAKSLIESARVAAQNFGAKRMDLFTARTNIAAQTLYENTQWVRDEHFYAYNLPL